ncbi:MAG: ABC transporter permease, partial [Rhodobacteraceae bacterium]|nr:ABC transporter permease [Paracoccaceae bacterium]
MLVVFQALWSFWRRAPMQLFTLIAGLALSTALWSGVQAINAEARGSYDAAAATLGEGQFARLLAADGGTIAQADYIVLRRAGWAVSPVVTGRYNGAQLIGIEPLTMPVGLSPVQLGGGDIAGFLTGAGQIFGRAETLDSFANSGAALIVLPTAPPGTGLADIAVAQRLLGMQGQISHLTLAAAQPSMQVPLADLEGQLSGALVLQQPSDESDLEQLTQSFHLNLTAFGLLAFSVGIFITHGAVGLAFEQRRPMVRTLRALGVPLGRLMALMAAEMAVFAVVAGIGGAALGYFIAAALLPDVAATLRGLYGAEVSGTLTLSPLWWLSALVVSLGGAALAAVGAFVSLARMGVLASAQPRPEKLCGGNWGGVCPRPAPNDVQEKRFGAL